MCRTHVRSRGPALDGSVTARRVGTNFQLGMTAKDFRASVGSKTTPERRHNARPPTAALVTAPGTCARFDARSRLAGVGVRSPAPWTQDPWSRFAGSYVDQAIAPEGLPCWVNLTCSCAARRCGSWAHALAQIVTRAACRHELSVRWALPLQALCVNRQRVPHYPSDATPSGQKLPLRFR